MRPSKSEFVAAFDELARLIALCAGSRAQPRPARLYPVQSYSPTRANKRRGIIGDVGMNSARTLFLWEGPC